VVEPLIEVEIVLAMPERQYLQVIRVPAGASVADAIAVSGVENVFPELAVNKMCCGIWGTVVDRTHSLRAGDRLEIYRPLAVNPRDARREIADAGGVMGGAAGKRGGD
jgi:putative ubiquitin-RnfH superfamily antitoxin RatB of RatAB toxin-antitoxin module